MSEDYLWDKSGEPDPEIQELEQILGTLRYQPHPLELPDDELQVRRRRYLPILAIAATLLIALLAGGLWLRTRNNTSPDTFKAGFESPTPHNELSIPTPNVNRHDQLASVSTSSEHPSGATDRIFKRPNRRIVPRMTKHEREEALEAKEQLMTALRLASEKLNLVQRKAQGASPNQIRNQHKVG